MANTVTLGTRTLTIDLDRSTVYDMITYHATNNPYAFTRGVRLASVFFKGEVGDILRIREGVGGPIVHEQGDHDGFGKRVPFGEDPVRIPVYIDPADCVFAGTVTPRVILEFS